MIAAVIVSYHPDFGELVRLLDALKYQVDRIAIVDNGSGSSINDFIARNREANIDYICLENNLGVAKAQNIGIGWARERSAEFVVLFDQDSIPQPNMIKLLHGAYQQQVAAGYRVAAVGPRYVDERNAKRMSFSRFSGLRMVKEDCSNSSQVILTDFVISSGSLISLKTLDVVGYMAEELFIDQVDIEWGFRAKFMGYQSFGVCDAIMAHSLGEAPLVILGRKLLNHSPLRHYYIFRNAVWLIFRKYTPLGWKLYFARMICIRYFLYPILVTPRYEYLKMMTKGLVDGLMSRMGKMNRIG